jgi:predicted component of type VI protein secretion system
MPPPPRRPSRHATPVDLAPPEAEAEDSSATIIQAPPGDGATVIMDRSALPGPVSKAKLVFLSGPKAGTEVKLTSAETTLGRQSDNAVVIPDISVSRHHVAVRRQGASYILADLGSGNGIILNGERVDGDVALQDGDIFAMGDTEVRFELPRPPPRGPSNLARRDASPSKGARSGSPGRTTDPAIPQPEDTTGVTDVSRRKGPSKRLLIVAGAVGVLMIVLIAAAKIRQGSAPKPPSPEEERIAAQGARMAQLYEEGKRALNAGDFKSAAAALGEAYTLAVEVNLDENEARNIRRQAEYAKGLVGGQDALEKAQNAGAQLQFARAMALLKPYSGEDHALHDTAIKVIDQMKARASEKLAAGKEALSVKDVDLARQALEDLKAVDPNLPECKELDGLIRDATQPRETQVKNRPTPATKDLQAPIVAAMAAGKLEDAIAAATAINAKAVKADLVSFRDGCKDLEADGAARRCGDLLRRIPGGEASPFMEPIHRRGAAAALNDGIKAIGTENWARAYQAFHQAQVADPTNAVAQKNLRTIRAKAKEFFEQAYVDRGVDPDKARRGFEAVISMTAPDDELNQKSKRHLKDLGGE